METQNLDLKQIQEKVRITIPRALNTAKQLFTKGAKSHHIGTGTCRQNSSLLCDTRLCGTQCQLAICRRFTEQLCKLVGSRGNSMVAKLKLKA